MPRYGAGVVDPVGPAVVEGPGASVTLGVGVVLPVGAGVPEAAVLGNVRTRYFDARTACALEEGATPFLLIRTTASASVTLTVRLDLSTAE